MALLGQSPRFESTTLVRYSGDASKFLAPPVGSLRRLVASYLPRRCGRSGFPIQCSDRGHLSTQCRRGRTARFLSAIRRPHHSSRSGTRGAHLRHRRRDRPQESRWQEPTARLGAGLLSGREDKRQTPRSTRTPDQALHCSANVALQQVLCFHRSARSCPRRQGRCPHVPGGGRAVPQPAGKDRAAASSRPTKAIATATFPSLSSSSRSKESSTK